MQHSSFIVVRAENSRWMYSIAAMSHTEEPRIAVEVGILLSKTQAVDIDVASLL